MSRKEQSLHASCWRRVVSDLSIKVELLPTLSVPASDRPATGEFDKDGLQGIRAACLESTPRLMRDILHEQGPGKRLVFSMDLQEGFVCV